MRGFGFVVCVGSLVLTAACGDEGGSGPANGGDGGANEGGAGTPKTPLPCDVVQVLQSVCWNCHDDPPQNGAPVALTSVEAFRARPLNFTEDRRIETALMRVQSASVPMPPPPNEPLTEQQVQVLQDWYDAGLPAGDGSCP